MHPTTWPDWFLEIGGWIVAGLASVLVGLAGYLGKRQLERLDDHSREFKNLRAEIKAMRDEEKGTHDMIGREVHQISERVARIEGKLG